MPFLLLLGSILAFAGDVVQGANLLAMGGVGAAAPVDNAGITMNPGLLGLAERYDFHAHVRLGPSLGLQWGASAMDGRTSKAVAVGLAYSGDRFEPAFTNADLPAWSVAGEELRNRKRLQDFALAVAVPILDRRVSIGATGDLTLFDHDREGQGRRFDMHAGLAVRPIDAITAGVALRNMWPGEVEERPIEILAGLRVEDGDRFAVEANLARTWLPPGAATVTLQRGVALLAEDPSVYTVSAGLDKRFGGAHVRAGGRWVGPTRQAFATFGLGTHDGEGGGLEYGVQVPIGPEMSFSGVVHELSVRFGAPPGIEAP